MASELTSASFVQELRRALRHLYVAAELRKSPLLELFGIAGGTVGGSDGPRGAAALRSILIEAVQALKPDASVPPRARPWRLHNTLLYLYVQQFSQDNVAAAMAISSRQLRRQESQALQLLADYLWTRYGLQDRVGSGSPAATADEQAPTDGVGTPSREQELEWLGRSLSTEAADLADLLAAALSTAGPLAERLRVQVESRVIPGTVRLAAQTAIVQQALLAILTATLRSVPGGRVTVEAELLGGRARIEVQAVSPLPGLGSLPADVQESLTMAQQLAALAGGSLETQPALADGQTCAIRLVLPRAEEVAVLVVDDNVDALRLFQRYLTGTRYPFIGARDPEQALALAQEFRPRIIVLDIMLAGVDGWQLLGHLREHPRTHGVPIVVCSILPEEELARTLGAVAYLRKPVSREAFLAALDRQAG